MDGRGFGYHGVDRRIRLGTRIVGRDILRFSIHFGVPPSAAESRCIDTNKLKELVRLMVDNDLTELDLQSGEETVTLKRAVGPRWRCRWRFHRR